MAEDFRITGVGEFKALSRRLKEQGEYGKGLKRELNKAIDEAAQRLIEEVHSAEESELPKRGGLAELVAGQRIRVAKTGTGIRLVQAGRTVKALKSMDAGNLRHPVYGNRKVWVSQQIKPGWWSKTLSSSKSTAAVRARIMRAMHEAAAKIEKG